MADVDVVVPGVELTETVVEDATVDTEAPAGEEYVNHNKRKFEESGDGEDDEAHIRKRGSAPTLDGEASVRKRH